MDLNHCPVVLVDGVAAGFTTVGIRKSGQAWCKGFGIVPAFRGSKLGIPLAKEMVKQARLAGARGPMTLGCMADNHARKTYEAAGFAVVRECFSLVWEQPTDAPAAATNPPPLVRAIAPAVILWGGCFARLHRSRPVYNREEESMREMSGLLCLAILDEASSGTYTVWGNTLCIAHVEYVLVWNTLIHVFIHISLCCAHLTIINTYMAEVTDYSE